MKSRVLFYLIVILTTACSKQDTNYYLDKVDCSTTTSNNLTYSTGIGETINLSCAYSGCHSTKSKADGIILDTYETAKSSFLSGEALCAINHGNGCTPMPEGKAKLADSLITQLSCWVKNGGIK